MTPWLVLAAWLGLNLLATRQVRRWRDHVRAPGMHIAIVWIAPFVGAGMALLEATVARRAAKEDAAAPRVPDQAPAPDHLRSPGVDPLPLRANLQVVQGFALVAWAAVDRWLATIPDDDARRDARLASHRAWLEHLRESMGEGFWLHASGDALILSSLDPAEAAAMSRYVTAARRRVAQTLGALARFPEGLHSVVLVMDDEDDYYAYISIYGSADGEQAFSGGCFIDAGCPHFVVRRADLGAIEPVIVHELTHSALAHLRLPLWVDEGLAVNTEQRLAGAHRGPHTPRELHAMHVAFWNDETIQEFWSGASFRRPDDGNRLSYDLARILVAQMGRSWPDFERFAQAAERRDAGASAAREQLNLELGAYVRLLCEREPGTGWQPVVEASGDSAAPPAAGIAATIGGAANR